jgi:hypothetical protein
VSYEDRRQRALPEVLQRLLIATHPAADDRLGTIHSQARQPGTAGQPGAPETGDPAPSVASA